VVEQFFLSLEEKESDQGIPQEFHLVDIHDTANLEVYGPHIDPIDFADVVNDANCPLDQNCTICAESYRIQDGQGTCVRLRNCGHHAHYHCIDEWLNGVAKNSNLCPECRNEICVNRRPVRVITSDQTVRIEGSDATSVDGSDLSTVDGSVHVSVHVSDDEEEELNSTMPASGQDDVDVYQTATAIARTQRIRAELEEARRDYAIDRFVRRRQALGNRAAMMDADDEEYESDAEGMGKKRALRMRTATTMKRKFEADTHCSTQTTRRPFSRLASHCVSRQPTTWKQTRSSGPARD